MNAVRTAFACLILTVGLGLYVVSYLRPTKGSEALAPLVPVMIIAATYLLGGEIRDQVRRIVSGRDGDRSDDEASRG